MLSLVLPERYMKLMYRNVTARTRLKKGDILVLSSPTERVFGVVSQIRTTATLVGERRLVYLSLGNDVEKFGTQKDFLGEYSWVQVTDLDGLVGILNHSRIAPINFASG